MRYLVPFLNNTTPQLAALHDIFFSQLTSPEDPPIAYHCDATSSATANTTHTHNFKYHVVVKHFEAMNAHLFADLPPNDTTTLRKKQIISAKLIALIRKGVIEICTQMMHFFTSHLYSATPPDADVTRHDIPGYFYFYNYCNLNTHLPSPLRSAISNMCRVRLCMTTQHHVVGTWRSSSHHPPPMLHFWRMTPHHFISTSLSPPPPQ